MMLRTNHEKVTTCIRVRFAASSQQFHLPIRYVEEELPGILKTIRGVQMSAHFNFPNLRPLPEKKKTVEHGAC